LLRGGAFVTALLGKTPGNDFNVIDNNKAKFFNGWQVDMGPQQVGVTGL
jgi:hypothetical protein